MFSEVAHINFEDDSIAVATFFIVIMMPFTYSITNGLAFGFISYLVLKLVKRETKDINIGIITLATVSLVAFLVH